MTPWVAVAAQLPVRTSHAHINIDTLTSVQASANFTGKFFTVLPLPIGTDQRVHIHGLFGITPDRARIYCEDDQRDNPMPAKWNRFLFHSVIPQAWAQLLLFISTDLAAHSTFDWWPLAKGAHTKHLPESIADRIQKEDMAVFPTEMGYKTVYESFLSVGSESTALQEALKEAKVPVVYTHARLRPYIESSFTSRMLSPSRLADLLKRRDDVNNQIRTWKNSTKKTILEYLVSSSSLLPSITSLELFPFEDGEYSSIANHGAFIHRDDLDKDLFGLDKGHSLDLKYVTTLTQSAIIALCNSPNQKSPIIRYRSASDLVLFLSKHVFHDISMDLDSVNLSELAASFVPKVWKWITRNLPLGQPSTFSGELAELWLLPLGNGQFRKLKPSGYFQEVMFVGTGDMADLLTVFASNPLSNSSPLLRTEKMGLKDKEISLLSKVLMTNGALRIQSSTNMVHIIQWLAKNSDLVAVASDKEKRVILKHLDETPRERMSATVLSASQNALQLLKIFEKVSWQTEPGKLTTSWTSLYTWQVSIGLSQGLIPIPDIDNHQFLIAKKGSVAHMLLNTFNLATCCDTQDIVERYIIPNFENSSSTMTLKVQVAKMLLRDWSHTYQDKLRGIAIVPVATVSNQAIQKFARPVDLIDPLATNLRDLFFDHEEVLPEAGFFQELGSALKHCGMKSDLEKVLVQNRIKCYAASDKPISEIQKRAHILLEFNCRWPQKAPAKEFIDLRSRAWLPVLVNGTLVQKSPAECRGSEDQLIAGFQKSILDLEISKAWKSRLGWDSKLPNEVLLAQLDKGLEIGDQAVVDAVLSHIAEKGQGSVLKKELQLRPLVLTSIGNSLPVSRVFLSGCERLAPYFGNVDTRFWKDHKVLLEILGVHSSVPQEQHLADLQVMLEGRVPLTDQSDIATAVELLTLRTNVDQDAILELKILCANGTFCAAKDVNYPNVEGVVGDYKLTHPEISHKLARKLGVEMLSEYHMKGLQAMADADDDTEYDQKEKNTTGISKNLDSYLISATFSEYLANADDAGSNSINWLLDERHHAGERLLTPELQRFQGPALLVHNDSGKFVFPKFVQSLEHAIAVTFFRIDFSSVRKQLTPHIVFTKSDWIGFKDLSVGSKSQNKTSIGQFGRGSQTMYHWTDCPMVLSGTWLLILE